MSAAPLFPLFALCRHRMGSDGAGVTTLAAARGCPLRCRYCLNPQALKEETPARMIAPEELYEMTRVDDLYFQATLGGVTFGGGEPLLYAPFIAAFRQCCGKAWRLTAETSLNVPEDLARAALPALDEVIFDVKDADPAIYRAYTGGDNARALLNLRLALETLGTQRVLARVPRLPAVSAASAERTTRCHATARARAHRIRRVRIAFEEPDEGRDALGGHEQVGWRGGDATESRGVERGEHRGLNGERKVAVSGAKPCVAGEARGLGGGFNLAVERIGCAFHQGGAGCIKDGSLEWVLAAQHA